jgi:hypothetical protein
MEWTLEYGGEKKTFSQWGICEVRRTRLNQGRDVVTFRHISAHSLSEAPTFEAFHRLVIYRDSEQWFMGTVAEIPVLGSGIDESRHYRICGPWWDLETLVYQQPWKMVENPGGGDPVFVSAYKSHVILGQSIDGSAIAVGQQLNDILSYAANCAVPMEISPIDLDQTMPFDECKDLSCAEAIQRVLRWIPDAVSWFDYSTPLPTLHVCRRSELAAVTFPLDDSVDLISISPRYSLNLLGVAVKYERVHSSGGHSWRTMEVDRYPPDVDEQQSRVLTMTVELAGTRSQYIIQNITAEEIQPQDAQWWCGHVPSLSSVDPATISILSCGRNSQLPRELRDGCVADWMAVAVEDDTVWATIGYGDGFTEISQQRVAVRLKATDATTRTYTRLSTYAGEEATPVGLARALWESFAAVTFDGTLQWIGEEIRDISMGMRLNLFGGQLEWQSMDAEIQECMEDIDRGTVRVKFGSAVHLGMRDLIQLTRVNRGREAPRSTYIRVSGEGSDEHIDQPSKTPVENSQMGITAYRKLSLENGDDATRKIFLDADQIAIGGLVMQPREEDVCENGVLKKRLTLASQPYSPNSP